MLSFCLCVFRMLNLHISTLEYSIPTTIGMKTIIKKDMLWYFGSNNKKNEIAELHIINVLIQT